jgi:hypothetical protein
MLVGRGLRSRLSLLPYIVIVYAVSAATLLLAVLLYNLPLYPYPPGTWLMFFLLALVPTIMGHTSPHASCRRHYTMPGYIKLLDSLLHSLGMMRASSLGYL